MNAQKRMFFAFEVSAPWPASYPHGRLLDERQRHLTAAFLGSADYAILQTILKEIPLPSFNIGMAGIFNQVIFLPKMHPRVAAWHVEWLDDALALQAYVRQLLDFLKARGFNPDDRGDFLPHVTICRSPFNFHEWRQAFQKLPMSIKVLHLYESLGDLQYRPLWSYPLMAPFEEIEHTADIAFKVRGKNVPQLFKHAFLALAYKHPELVKYRNIEWSAETIEDVIIQLNAIVSKADADTGCPFKAVSFHGEIETQPDGTLTWEMIVDV